MKNLFLFSLLFISSLCFAQDADKTVSITVSGSGKTQVEAKQSALRSAIEQAFGTFISSKTEILNDQVVADQMASVSNGNIQSYTILNEGQLPDSTWGITLKAIVSVNKLTSFVEAKGIEIELKGGLFVLNIKQQLLNEQGEIKAICEMIGLLHEPMQTSFDYSIKSGEPKSIDAESKNWEIPLTVTAICNKNIDFCANYCIKTLAAISLSPEEVANYQSLNKDVFPIEISYKGETKTFNLRKGFSKKALITFIQNWEFYTRLFTVQAGMDEISSKGKGEKFEFGDYYGSSINFPTSSQQVATFSWQDKRDLNQLEKMTGYKIKPSGVVSQFKLGGFVVYEENGHGLVCSITDLGEMTWGEANNACDKLVLNGYSDWSLPSLTDMEKIQNNLYKFGIASLNYMGQNRYWTSSNGQNSQMKVYSIDRDFDSDFDKWLKVNVRAIRKF
jgi:hypothetical protein